MFFFFSKPFQIISNHDSELCGQIYFLPRLVSNINNSPSQWSTNYSVYVLLAGRSASEMKYIEIPSLGSVAENHNLEIEKKESQ
jgi:hypothetical protein